MPTLRTSNCSETAPRSIPEFTVQAKLRTLAANDTDDAVAYYRNEVSPETALGFICERSLRSVIHDH